MDRDTKFCELFRNILIDESVESVRLPARSPNLNAQLIDPFLSFRALSICAFVKVCEDALTRAPRTASETSWMAFGQNTRSNVLIFKHGCHKEFAAEISAEMMANSSAKRSN